MTESETFIAGRRVMVTGATGFIGARLVDRLIRAGADVHAVSRRQRADDSGGVRWWRADLEDFEATAELVGSVEPDVVFHLAGTVSGEVSPALVAPMIRSNLLTTVNVLESAHRAKCDRILIACSVVEPELGPDELPASSPYAASKWASWGYARMFHALWDVPAVVLRVTMVYGPGQSDPRKLIPHVANSLLDGESPRITSGRDRYDWVYIDDVVDALLLAATARGVEGETLEIGSGGLTSVRELAHRLGRLVDPEVELAFGEAPDRPLPPPARVADLARTAQLIGWKPATPLNEGLERTAAWFRNRTFAGVAVAAQPMEFLAQFGVVC